MTPEDQSTPRPYRFVICGAGFWAHYQLAAWKEIPGVECVGICDRDLARARKLADEFSIPIVSDQFADIVQSSQADFVDIISSPESHAELVRAASELGKGVICQKPMTPTWTECLSLVELCDRNKTWFAIHENWRWQKPLLRLRQILESGIIGTPFRCNLSFITGFDVFANQPTLKEQKRFIIADLGCHLLDYARSLFGEADQISCNVLQSDRSYAGENVATIMLRMNNQQTIVTLNMAYALSPIHDDCFPQTLAFVEGTEGSIRLEPNYEILTTTKNGTTSEIAHPKRYSWANPQYLCVHSSLVDCNKHLFDSFRMKRPAATSGDDNLRTMQLVFAAYETAENRNTLILKPT
jgi:D-apiose dehydrogenase